MILEIDDEAEEYINYAIDEIEKSWHLFSPGTEKKDFILFHWHDLIEDDFIHSCKIMMFAMPKDNHPFSYVFNVEKKRY